MSCDVAIKQEPVEPAGVYSEAPAQLTSSEAAVTSPVSVIETPALPATAAMETNQYAHAHASLVSHADVRAAMTCDAVAVTSDEQEMPLALTTKPATSPPAHDINSLVKHHKHNNC